MRRFLYLMMGILVTLWMTLFPIMDAYAAEMEMRGSVYGGIIDDDLPVFESLTINGQSGDVNVKPGDTVEIVVRAYDEGTDISSVDISFKNNANKTLYCYLENRDWGSEYWDEDKQEWIIVKYPNNEWRGTIEITEEDFSNYILDKIRIYDFADNRLNLYNDYGKDKEYSDEISFTKYDEEFSIPSINVLVEGDTIRPALESIDINKTSFDVGDTLEVTVKASDEGSGVGYISVRFCKYEWEEDIERYQVVDSISIGFNDRYWNPETQKVEKYGDNIWVGEYTIKGNEEGEYQIDRISITDKAENRVYYERYIEDEFIDEEHKIIPEKYRDLKFIIINEDIDNEPPIIKNITLNENKVTAPGYIEYTCDVEDDKSGARNVTLFFYNYQTYPSTGNYVIETYAKNTYWHNEREIPYEDGLWHGRIDINAYKHGEFKIGQIHMRDKAGNNIDLYRDSDDENQIPVGMLDIGFTVENDGKGVTLTTSASNNTLIDKIKELGPDDASIMLDYTDDSRIKKEIFEALKEKYNEDGTEVKLRLASSRNSGNTVEWEFNAGEINLEDCKNIDLNAWISLYDSEDKDYWSYSNQIAPYVEDKKALIVQFPDNGKLPGKATIRIKADYATRMYLDKTGLANANLNVYWFDQTEQKMKKVPGGVRIEEDYYIIFEVDHNSIFLITTGEINETLKGAPDDYDSSFENTVITKPAQKMVRLFNPQNGDHLYSDNQGEQNELLSAGWREEGAPFAVSKDGNGEKVYRLHNLESGEHIYTKDTREYNLLKSKGWIDEGIAFVSAGDVAVYRLYLPKKGGKHLFTVDWRERDVLIKSGWIDEGEAFRVQESYI